MDPEPPVQTSDAPEAPLETPDPEMFFSKGLRVAIQGCGHGMLDQIYATIEQACHINNYKVDLLIICGDFQAVRNSRDLLSMSVPPKYRHMGDFYKYYNGSRVAPIPTIFVGGNHEASTHMWEVNLGGWVCPNIYYLGGTGVINVNGIRIAGVSGIYNENSYRKPRYEKPPFDDRSMRGAYHYRAHELFKLNMLSGDVDVFISHDWPEGITKYGNEKKLLQAKYHFRAEVAAGKLGSPPLRNMLLKMKPKYWFAAHMHVKFPAVIDHVEAPRKAAPEDPKDWTDQVEMVEAKNEDEIDLDMDDEEAPPPKKEDTRQPTPPRPVLESPTPQSSSLYPSLPTTNCTTRFLALDKLLPGRDFLQIINIASRSPLPLNSPLRTRLQYDREWLTICRAFEPMDVAGGEALGKYMKIARNELQVNKKIRTEFAWVNQNITDEQLIIPENWERTAKLQWDDHTKATKQPDPFNNPQTETLCNLIGIKNKWVPPPYMRKSLSPEAPDFKPAGQGIDSTMGESSSSAVQRAE
ncbi:hypothetical protein H072_6142 [Dactylellina haptotyla CBS 200.50]|uniref:Lariat debranching enzyme C-terminal domain-containing protein n=1 Tax=Dactylellina haptotyla (strain CBS 200.50) TaxID=1284197 RepID=S8AAM3_DACHA|nr:hypothetical protein H072_6142 [Dactylellina haptotyla CBS 200.50]